MERTAFDKVGSFAAAAAHRAFDMDGWRQYAQDEREKFIGIGDGLNAAKDGVLHAAAGACRAVVDGSAITFVAHAGEYVVPAVVVAADAVTHVVQHPDAVAHAVQNASDKYSALPPREKGKVIGETMFAMINPEGSLEGPTLALRAADNVATHVDGAVMAGVEKFAQAIRDMRQSAPELAECAERMLRDYMRELGLAPHELEWAVVPTRTLLQVEKTEVSAQDYFYAMVNGERKPWSWEVVSREITTEVVRQSTNDSCVAAVGQMLTKGEWTEEQILRALGDRLDFIALRKLLGSEWETRPPVRSVDDLWALCTRGPWGAILFDHPNFHAVVVDRIDRAGRVLIRDPWDGSKCVMTQREFLKYWDNQLICRTEK